LTTPIQHAIGDMRRFSHRGALIAYAGVDPQPAESGKQSRSSDPISRKGSGLIHKVLFHLNAFSCGNLRGRDTTLFFCCANGILEPLAVRSFSEDLAKEQLSYMKYKE